MSFFEADEVADADLKTLVETVLDNEEADDAMR